MKNKVLEHFRYENVIVYCMLPKWFGLKIADDYLGRSRILLVANQKLDVGDQFGISEEDTYWTALLYSQLTSDQKQGIDHNVKKFVEALTMKETIPNPIISWLSFTKISSILKYPETNIIFTRDVEKKRIVLEIVREIKKEDFIIGFLNGKGYNKDNFVQSFLTNSKSSPNILQYCAFCNDVRNRPALLERHLRVHTGERPAKCQLCSKSFANSNTLKQHINTHTGKKPYKCSECGQGFAANSNLAFHMEIHYPERKKHKCSTCQKMFSTPSELKIHGYSHSKIYPYQCEKCHSSYAKYSNILKHRHKCVTKSTKESDAPLSDLADLSAKENSTQLKIQRSRSLAKPSIFHSIDTIITAPVSKHKIHLSNVSHYQIL